MAPFNGRVGDRVVGPTANRHSMRVPTTAFKTEGRASGDVARSVEDHRVAIRFGDFHSRRLIAALEESLHERR